MEKPDVVFWMFGAGDDGVSPRKSMVQVTYSDMLLSTTGVLFFNLNSALLCMYSWMCVNKVYRNSSWLVGKCLWLHYRTFITVGIVLLSIVMLCIPQ